MGRPFADYLAFKPINILGSTKKGKRRQLTHAQQKWGWDNKSHTCTICGKRVTKITEAEFDHSRAYSKSGATNLANVKIVHRSCNRQKGNKSLSATKKFLGIKYKIKKRKNTKKKSSNKRAYWVNPITGRKEKIQPLFQW